MTIIRSETSTDIPAIQRVNELAFARPDEARLVAALRGQVSPWLSLVACVSTTAQVVGHALFTPVTIEEASTTSPALALGPIAVLPEFQKQGIGGELIRAGLAECARLEQWVVFVLGHPHYYPRFGFVPAKPLGLPCTYPVPEDVFMVAELKPGALAGRRGLVRYHPIFDTV